MKKFLLGSVGLAAMIAGPAMAADMRLPPPPPPVVYYDWSGAYIGFNAGSASGPRSIKISLNRLLFGGTGPGNGKSFSTSPSDGIFGFHAGAQWQWGAWVLGAEAALSGCFSECRGTSGIVSPPGIAANTFFEHKITNLFTVGPRLGYAWDRLMIFATGGYASADLKSTACSQLPVFAAKTRFNGQSRNNGWYAGGGFDYMVHKGPLVDVLLGLEYQHFDVGSKNAFCFNPGCNPATGWDEDLSAKGDIVRARLTIKTKATVGSTDQLATPNLRSPRRDFPSAEGFSFAVTPIRVAGLVGTLCCVLRWRRYTPISRARLISMAVYLSLAFTDIAAAWMGGKCPTTSQRFRSQTHLPSCRTYFRQPFPLGVRSTRRKIESKSLGTCGKPSIKVRTNQLFVCCLT